MKIDRENFSIETERLVLKPVSMEWKDDIFREFTHEITVYMFPDPPKEISETEDFIRETQKDADEGTEVHLVILDKASGEFLGIAGLHHMESTHPELGIWIKKSAHGKKYGREAIHGVKEWVDTHLTYEYIVYPVDRDNIASRKIPESLGGTVQREYEKKTISGGILNALDYHIYPSDTPK